MIPEHCTFGNGVRGPAHWKLKHMSVWAYKSIEKSFWQGVGVRVVIHHEPLQCNIWQGLG